MTTVECIQLDRVLNSATSGDELFARVQEALATTESVDLDFRNTYRMTPSYSNTFVMRLCHALSTAEFRRRCRILNAAEHVSAAIENSVQRFDSGIRLSDQW